MTHERVVRDARVEVSGLLSTGAELWKPTIEGIREETFRAGADCATGRVTRAACGPDRTYGTPTDTELSDDPTGHNRRAGNVNAKR